MARVIVRIWNGDGYHKDVARLDEKQVRMTCGDMGPKSYHMTHPIDAVRVVIDRMAFPEAVEFEVIVEE